ncbi:hypothetical protein D6774_03165 [Candidatus Woesearchaeota archaeon]|jgi:hypothetical protein|nr:MAG: hypothetical protein D6774_03165 [Candidatus Woesearchaeota archaeon]
MTFFKSYLTLTAILSLLIIPLSIEPTITGMSILSQTISTSIFITIILLGVIGLLIAELIITKPAAPVIKTRTLEHVDEDIKRITRRLKQ